jgi:RNA polymerase sigma-32 factor
VSISNLSSKLSHHVESYNHLGTPEDPHEYQLIDDWRSKTDERALKRLLDNHQKLIKMIANGYRGYGLPLEELIAEGHVGLMHAVKNFDIERGFKFSTYAVWWVKSTVQEYIFKASSLLSHSGSKKHKRMFFKLRSLVHKYGYFGQLTNEQADHIAAELEVTREDILHMHTHLTTKDLSTNEKIGGGGEGDDGTAEWQDWIEDSRPNQETYTAERQEYIKRATVLKDVLNSLKERDRLVFYDRRIKEPPRTLDELGKEFSLSKERIRQIEEKAFEKIQIEVKRLSFHHGLCH